MSRGSRALLFWGLFIALFGCAPDPASERARFRCRSSAECDVARGYVCRLVSPGLGTCRLKAQLEDAGQRDAEGPLDGPSDAAAASDGAAAPDAGSCG